ncbi:MAG: hypothetical protein OXI26_11760 [bacterium]|nr:hypothetical protein [bacterium]
MKDFSFGLATKDDDAAIRHLLSENPVPGRITVTYEREPDYFMGCGTMGRFWQVGVARHLPTGRLAGVGCRATRPMFINGTIEEVGYLGQLRVDSRFRGRWLPAFGMHYFRELHRDGRVSGYVTTIVENNEVARGVLVDRPRSHHPTYREIGRLKTLAVALRRPRSVPRSPYEIGKSSDADLSDLVSFLTAHGRQKNLFPAYRVDDFRNSTTTPGFRLDDFRIARRDGQIVGVIGLWDQSGFKQTVVQAYSGTVRRIRPAYNAVSRLLGGPPLPAPGEPIRNVYGSFVCIERNDPEIFHALLQYVYNEAARRGYAYLFIGLDTRDPLLAVVEQYPHVAYPSRLYTVCLDDEGEFHSRLDGRVPHVEIAAL